ncbi:MAG: glycerophosphodiester phosphodiesterase [Acidobacteria bacterium]|nr:glycerophosphodiester phosphodiesterase [Acidobacteriota bacterium]
MKRPLLLGHRGARASRHIPENTLASFELCLQRGCDGFEFDVRRSADGVAVVCHDPHVRGRTVDGTMAADLELPTLNDVLQGFGARAFLDIELKVAGIEEETMSLLHKFPPQKGYVISSFLPAALTRVHELDPDVPLGFLCDERSELGRWEKAPVEWVIPHFSLADQALIEKCHAAGKRVMVWTVNDADGMRELVRWGVDAIITDETEIGSRVVIGL